MNRLSLSLLLSSLLLAGATPVQKACGQTAVPEVTVPSIQRGGDTASPTATPTVKQKAWLAASPNERVGLAEKIGEDGAEAFAAKHGYKPVLLRGDKALPYGFDQVYIAKDGTLVVIEAKGGSSALGHAYGHPQGSPGWAVEAAQRVASSSKATAAERHAAVAVLDAARNGNLTVQVVRTKHMLGEPIAAVLEGSLKGGAAEAKAATTFLNQLPVAAKSAPAAGIATHSVKVSSSNAATLAKVGKAAGVVAVVVDGGVRVVSAVETERKYESGEISNDERVTAHAKNAAGMAGGLGGAWAGAKCGATTGGAVGAIFGPVGVPVGGFIGGTVGAVGGYLGGECLGEAVVDAWRSLWR